MADVWDKRDNESAIAFEAFARYRDAQESHAQVAAALGKSLQLMYRWSREHAWSARRDAYIAQRDRVATQAQLRAIGEAEAERTREIAAMNERHIKVARAIMGKIAKRLTDMTDADVAAMEPKDVARWVEVAVKVERLARGVTTEQVAHTGKDGEAIQVDIREQAKQRVSGILGEVLAEGAQGGVVGKPN